eukprot:SAG31_NODE_1918_length_6921_cov_2.015245_2_plen_122_part_00
MSAFEFLQVTAAARLLSLLESMSTAGHEQSNAAEAPSAELFNDGRSSDTNEQSSQSDATEQSKVSFDPQAEDESQPLTPVRDDKESGAVLRMKLAKLKLSAIKKEAKKQGKGVTFSFLCQL